MVRKAQQRKRVVMFLDFFPHYRGPVMRELLQSPCHDYVLAGALTDKRSGNIKTWPIPDDAPFIHIPRYNFRRPWAWQRGAIGLAFRRHVDVIIYHADYHLISTWISAPLARLLGKRVLFYTMGWRHHERPVRKLIKRIYLNLAHGLCLYGHWAKMEGIRQGYNPNRLFVVYNSLEYDKQKQIRETLTHERLRQIRAELFEHPERPQIICTGRIMRRRRLDLALDALHMLQQRGKHVNLLLVGDGSEREPLEKQANEYGLPVHFYGSCYDEEILAGLIASSNATVAPGMIGLTAIHSMAYGTPVIAHDDHYNQGPESEIIVDGWNGSLFKHGNIEDLARCIDEWTQDEFPTPATHAACDSLLKRIYNPQYMRRGFDWAAGGEPANDLFWALDGEGNPADSEDEHSFPLSES